MVNFFKYHKLHSPQGLMQFCWLTTYHNYAEAKRMHQVQKIIHSNPASDIMHSVKTTVYDQNNNMQ